MIIYKTTNLINGLIYIGKDCNNNPNYLGSGLSIRRAVKKYGKENFKKEVIEVCDGDNWCERERYWIKILDARNRFVGYNICEGGEGFTSAETKGKRNPMFGIHMPSYFKGMHHTEKTKKKISEARRGQHLTEETKRKISETLTGKKRPGVKHVSWNRGKKGLYKTSEETKRKISASLIGEKGPNFGKHLSAETKQKISNSRVGRFSGKNHPMFGRHHSEETKAKMRKPHKRRPR
jgi:group I intron endonuclease